MAEIEKATSKKASTKVDMTPMVDLAFLLITFFMLTTSLTKPQALHVNMPENGPSTPVKGSNALTIILGENDKIYWYSGESNEMLSSTDYSAEGIRHLLNSKKQEIGSDLVVLVKAMKKAKFNNLVNVLDELNITQTNRFAIVTITSEDEELVRKKNA